MKISLKGVLLAALGAVFVVSAINGNAISGTVRDWLAGSGRHGDVEPTEVELYAPEPEPNPNALGHSERNLRGKQ